MQRTTLRMILLVGTLALAPSLSLASPDCGDETVKTAEVVHTIPTPRQVFLEPALTPEVLTIEQQPLAPASTAPAVDKIAPAPVIKTTEVVKTAQLGSHVNGAVTAYQAVLKRRIKRGPEGLNLFDYAGAKAAGEYKTIKAYTDYLASKNPDQMPQNDQIAYWANLYNALTVKLILENYPVKSIRKIKAGTFSTGPWKRDEVTVNGQVLSLNDIEHEILRKRYPNPALVHYMVNCASIGCPNLRAELWNGATLDADRDAAARDFINSPRGVEIRGGKLKASSIYDWFKVDFGGSKPSTLQHFRKYAGPELRAAIDAGATIDGYGYNWDLNE